MNERHRHLPERLIELGKARGQLTYGEIVDHLPRDVLDSDLSSIVSRLTDFGIVVQFPEHGTIGDIAAIEEDMPLVSMVQIGAFRSADASVRCRFSFVCDRRWEDLTEGPDFFFVRHCDTCRRTVHLCLTPEEAAEAIRGKQCVALAFRHELDPVPRSKRSIDPILLRPISELDELPQQTIDGLLLMGIERIGDLVQVADDDPRLTAALSPVAVIQVKDVLASRGLILSSSVPGWPD